MSYDRTILSRIHSIIILRKQKKMSQQELSDKLETLAIYICRGSISQIEDKSRTVTDIELYGLAKVLEFL